MQKKKKISIITPCFNEADSIEECCEAVKQVFNGALDKYEYEHIFCDNNSSDATVELLKRIAARDQHIKIICNSRNFGAFNSMYNGLMAATGDAVIPFLPADLQDPPGVIPELVLNWERGFDIVYGVRSNREESWIMHTLRKLYYRLVSKFANIDIPLNVGEFTLIDKRVQDALRKYEDYYPYLRGMIASCGFRSTKVSYTWKSRKKGASKSNFYVLIDSGLNGLISFTNLPMRLCMLFGFFIASVSIMYSIYALIATLLDTPRSIPSGIPTLTVALFFFSGLNLFFLGFLGEYVCAIHSQVRKRPLVIESERTNF